MPSGRLSCERESFEVAAVFPFDAARDTAGFGVIRHQHHVAPCKADVGGESGAFGATLFLIYLHDHFCAFFQHILNAHLTLAFRGPAAVVLGRDLFKGQKTVAVCTKVDERCLEAGFDPE